MATGSTEERKKRMVEAAKSRMVRRGAMRPKKTYRPPMSYPRQFTPQMREAQKKLIDSPEMESYMKSLIAEGYMVEIGGKPTSAETLATEAAADASSETDEEDTLVEGADEDDASGLEEAPQDVEGSAEEAAAEGEENEEGPVLGAGGMADTRDPEVMDHEDPRKSISAAPSFEDYLKSRSSS